MKPFIKMTRLQDLLLVCLLVAVSFAIYANTLQNDFVWDDITLLVENYDRWQWTNWKELVTTHDNLFRAHDTGYYRPLINLTYLLDRQLWGHRPFGYHLTNIVFHILSAAAVFLIVKAIFNSALSGGVAGLVFAVHPVHTETVAWINGRNNAVSALFFLLAFYFYLRQKGRRKRLFSALSFVAFFLSLLSKEYALVFPLVIVLYELSFGNITHGRLLRIGATTLRQCLPYLVIMAAYLLLRSWILPGHGMMDFQLDTIWFRILTVPKVVCTYFRLMILPIDLNAFYHVSLIRSPLTSAFLLYGAVFFGLMLFWCVSYHRSKTLFFGIGWILITLVPVLNIVPLAYPESFISEHYMYLPMLGFCVPIARLTKYLLPIRPPVAWKYGILMVLLSAVAQYGFETAKRNLVWRNELTLWSDTVVKSPRNFRVRCNLSIALHAVGRTEEAIAQIHEAIRLKPAEDTPYFILGVLLFDSGRMKQSEKAFDKVLSINPRHKDALAYVARIRKQPTNRSEPM